MRDGHGDQLAHLVGAEARRRVGRAGAEVVAHDDGLLFTCGVDEREDVAAQRVAGVVAVGGRGAGCDAAGVGRQHTEAECCDAWAHQVPGARGVGEAVHQHHQRSLAPAQAGEVDAVGVQGDGIRIGCVGAGHAAV